LDVHGTLACFDLPESKTKGKEGKKPYEAQKSFAIVASPKQDEEGQKEERSEPVSRVHPIIER
jgi:hypothetical protein